METDQHDFHFAIRNFLKKDECEGIALSGEVSLIQDRINKAIFDWNDQTDNGFIVDYMKNYDVKVITHEDETTVDHQKLHTPHNGNMLSHCPKIQAYVFLTDRDEYQGGEIETEGWQGVPYQDNFGEWIGDPDGPHQPDWLNEQGTLYITHSSNYIGFARTHNGSKQVMRIIVSGPAYR